MNISQKLADERKKDPELLARIEIAAQGQSPRFLIISSIHRSSQDLQILNMGMGDAFHATRVTNHALLFPDISPYLFKGPASYHRYFPGKKGIIATFEATESDDVVKETITNINRHPDLDNIPIIALKIDYESVRVYPIPHGKNRDYEAENWILSRVREPDMLDDDLLVLICSDSRVHPPHSEKGVPMAIQTLGGYVPSFTGHNDETRQLESFFESWLSDSTSQREILIVAHGNFEGEGPSCGAATISLNPNEAPSNTLYAIVKDLHNAAQQFENTTPETPEERVRSLCHATRQNLMSYPSISSASEKGLLSIDKLFMDTVSNVLYQEQTTKS
jgi:carbonic anhydrase